MTVITRPLLAWDQLALRSVTIGSDIDGYWTAAFGDNVRYVLRQNSEISQRQYGAVLITHLASPVVAATAFLFLAMVLIHRRADEAEGEALSTA